MNKQLTIAITSALILVSVVNPASPLVKVSADTTEVLTEQDEGSIELVNNCVLLGTLGDYTVSGIAIANNTNLVLEDADGNKYHVEYYWSTLGDDTDTCGLLRVAESNTEYFLYEGQLTEITAIETDAVNNGRLAENEHSKFYTSVNSDMISFFYNTVYSASDEGQFIYYAGNPIVTWTSNDIEPIINVESLSMSDDLSEQIFALALQNGSFTRSSKGVTLTTQVGTLGITVNYEPNSYCSGVNVEDLVKDLGNELIVDKALGGGFCGSKWTIIMQSDAEGYAVETDDLSVSELLKTFEDTNLAVDSIPVKFVFNGYNGSLTLGNFYTSACDLGDTIVNDWWQIAGDVNDDGVYNVIDLIMMKSQILGETSLTTKEFINADINSDKVVDSLDLMALKKQLFLGY